MVRDPGWPVTLLGRAAERDGDGHVAERREGEVERIGPDRLALRDGHGRRSGEGQRLVGRGVDGAVDGRGLADRDVGRVDGDRAVAELVGEAARESGCRRARRARSAEACCSTATPAAGSSTPSAAGPRSRSPPSRSALPPLPANPPWPPLPAVPVAQEPSVIRSMTIMNPVLLAFLPVTVKRIVWLPAPSVLLARLHAAC